jgi:phosphoglycolate phosphatase
MYRLIVFDLDGTLVDSRKDLAQATNRLLVERGGRALDEDDVVRMVGEGAAKLVGRAFAAAGFDVTPDALPRFLELYGERLCVHTRPYPGVPEMLESIGREAPMAVLTNKPRALSDALLAGLGLARHFARIVGGDGPHPRKPDPTSLRALAADFGAGPREALLVGDSVFDVRTARAAGTPIVLVGYGFGFHDIPPVERAFAEAVVDDPADLVVFISGRQRGSSVADALRGSKPGARKTPAGPLRDRDA